MPIDKDEILKRSVDSLQKIYAVVIALAIGQAIQTLVLDPGTHAFTFDPKTIYHLPAFLAFVVVLVPFYHGMNRHLDSCYIENVSQAPVGALLFDFFIFFVEASLLFAVAPSVRAGLDSFMFLGILLVADIFWALVSHWIHYREISPSILRWAVINFITIVASLSVVLRNDYEESSKMWLLFLLAVARSVADYWSCWAFYFPGSRHASAPAKEVASQTRS